MTVHQYDIVLDVTVTNRTADTLQNLNLELATMGDLKLVERPQNYALRPHGQQNIRCDPAAAYLVTTSACQSPVVWEAARLGERCDAV